MLSWGKCKVLQKGTEETKTLKGFYLESRNSGIVNHGWTQMDTDAKKKCWSKGEGRGSKKWKMEYGIWKSVLTTKYAKYTKAAIGLDKIGVGEQRRFQSYGYTEGNG